jgi:transposase InsO family protein
VAQVSSELGLPHCLVRAWLRRAAVLDLFSRKVLGWAMAEDLGHDLALAALDMAIASRRPAPGLLHHSDRAVPYAIHGYRRRLQAQGMLCSMSRKRDCWDYAPMERFYATLKGEQIEQRNYLTRADARPDLLTYIEGFCNRLSHPGADGGDSPSGRFGRVTVPAKSGPDTRTQL